VATITGTIRLPADGLHLHYGRTGLLSEVDRARAAAAKKGRRSRRGALDGGISLPVTSTAPGREETEPPAQSLIL
jgi:hypothetical protein